MSDIEDTSSSNSTPTAKSGKNKEKNKSGPAPPKKLTTTKQSLHPKTSVMVNTAIIELNERKGSSLHAIKKFIAAKYLIDVDKISLHIRKYLKSAVESGILVQTKGKGANGSFKLATPKAKPKKDTAEEKPKKDTAEENPSSTEFKKNSDKKTTTEKKEEKVKKVKKAPKIEKNEVEESKTEPKETKPKKKAVKKLKEN